VGVNGGRRRVLVLNCGSSSVKAALVDPTTAVRTLTALAERVGTGDATLRLRRGSSESPVSPAGGTHSDVVGAILAALTDEERSVIGGVGHRVVHGGRRFAASVPVDEDVLAALHELTDLAPLHLPANLAGIDAARAQLPALTHVAVFDTAFHQTMPPVAYRYAVPTEWYEKHHVRRYGFHGTSHRYVSDRAAELLRRPLNSLAMVTLHLGNGCSAAAVRDGECRRHDHGSHAPGGPGDGHPQRRHRPRRARLCCRAAWKWTCPRCSTCSTPGAGCSGCPA
jgi:acetate kinase